MYFWVDVFDKAPLGGFVQDVDEKLLYDTFSSFGVIVTNPKVFLASLGSFVLFSFHQISYLVWSSNNKHLYTM